jgi:bisphosphoglycerate-dependent phosphoglycerate mutase
MLISIFLAARGLVQSRSLKADFSSSPTQNRKAIMHKQKSKIDDDKYSVEQSERNYARRFKLRKLLDRITPYWNKDSL